MAEPGSRQERIRQRERRMFSPRRVRIMRAFWIVIAVFWVPMLIEGLVAESGWPRVFRLTAAVFGELAACANLAVLHRRVEQLGKTTERV